MHVILATRPNLAYTISMLSQFNKNPNSEHQNALHLVMRYLQAMKSKGLVYRTDKLDVYGYADADWGGDLDTRHSMMVTFIYWLGGSVLDKQISAIDSLIHDRSRIHVSNSSGKRSNLAYSAAERT